MPGKRGAPLRSRSSRLSRSSSFTVRNSCPEARSSPRVRGRSVGGVGTSVEASGTPRTLLRRCAERPRPGRADWMWPRRVTRGTLARMTDVEILRYAAFSADPAGGNPAGVVLDAAALTDDDMLAI